MYITYINLAHRTDRREQVESELQKLGVSNYTRFDAIRNTTHGGLGCVSSHIQCLNNGLASGKPYIMVLEDDVEFKMSRDEWLELLFHLASLDFDVVTMDYNEKHGQFAPCAHPFFKRVLKSHNLTFYIVAAHYVPTLRKNFEVSRTLLSLIGQYNTFAVDRWWNLLQQKHKWYTYYKRLAEQRGGYSDIGQRVVKN